MGGARRAENAVEPVATRAADALTGKPGVHLAFERRRRRLAQQLVGKPSPQPRFGPLVETGDRKAVENEPPMATARPSRPFVVFQHFDADTDLGRQIPDDRRSRIGLIVRKAAVPPPTHELYGKPELACVGHPGKPRQILGSKSPVLSNLFTLHRSAPSRARRLRTAVRPVTPTWPFRTDSRSLGHIH